MSPKVAKGRRSSDYKWADPVAVYAAQELGMRPASVEQLLRGRGRLDLRTAALIRAFIAAAEHQRLAAFLAPIELATTQRPVQRLDRSLIVAAQTADLDEDEEEMMYHTGPCEQSARRWVAAIDRERSAQLIVREALAHHWELR